MASPTISVRPANACDMKNIMAMIQELALFEKMPNKVMLNEADLIRDGGFEAHQSQSLFQSFIIEIDSEEQITEHPTAAVVAVVAVAAATAAALRSEVGDEETEKNATVDDKCVRRLLTRRSAIGYAVGFYGYSTWEGKVFYLEDIYIRPTYRNAGAGETLFKYVTKFAEDNDCVRVCFYVLDWNPASRFYRRLGAEDITETEGWHFYQLNRHKMAKLQE